MSTGSSSMEIPNKALHCASRIRGIPSEKFVWQRNFQGKFDSFHGQLSSVSSNGTSALSPTDIFETPSATVTPLSGATTTAVSLSSSRDGLASPSANVPFDIPTNSYCTPFIDDRHSGRLTFIRWSSRASNRPGNCWRSKLTAASNTWKTSKY
ncbi:1209_t:CDS:2 [Acaulospora morrowiae]|uniref:1209_t:CDS:1 n=1 Tax=Acaulospora morrowiae TaxID=94023 RepID=A0A9N9CSJ8_9GLOM|nr:1209_t:CDS:2 [Acaulospora morrowiae]